MIDTPPPPVTSAEPEAARQAQLEARLENTQRQGRTGKFFSYLELRRAPYGILPAMLFALSGLFVAVQARIINFAGPNIGQDLHISAIVIIGISVTSQFILLFVGIAFAYYLDRRSRARWIGIGGIVQALGQMAFSRATNASTLTAPVVATDVGGAIQAVPATALVADYYPPEYRGRVFALITTLRRIGLLGATVFGGLAVAHWGWRSLNIMLGVPVLLISLVALLALREPKRGYFERRAMGFSDAEAKVEDPPLSVGESFRTIFAVKTVRRLVVADMVAAIGDFPFVALVPFMLADFYGLDVQQRALISLPALLLSITGGYLGGGALDFITKRAPSSVLRIAGGLGIAAAGVNVIIALGLPLWAYVISSSLSAFFLQLIAPASFSLLTQVIPPNCRTLGLSLTSLAEAPSFLLAPAFLAMLSGAGYSAALLAGVPFVVISALIRLTAADFFERDRREALIQSLTAREWETTAAQATGAKQLLLCRNVNAGYDGVQVLFDVDFEVDEGEIVALLGTNGAGKSTLLRAISGTNEADGGSIIFNGRDITHMPPNEIAGHGVIQMPGGRGTFSGLSVRDNLELGAWMQENREAGKARLERVYQIFPILAQRASEPSGALSGGEQQMLSLAQAFLCNPKLLLIDELSLGLSPAVVGQLLDIVKQIRAQGTAIVIVEQSVNVALTVADRAVFMEKGEVKFSGATGDLLRRPDILRAVYVKGTVSVGGGGSVVDENVRRRRQQEISAAPVILEATGVVKRFGGITALNGVDLSLRQGEVLGLIGPNGSGKTTLLDIISGEQRADEGVIHYKGVDITGLSPEERARRKLVRRFQDARLFPSLTVYESLLVALDMSLEVKNTLLFAAALPRARRAERRLRSHADRLIELLALEAYRDKFVSELSTGVRRILDLAFVLALEAEVLLLDEPSSGIAQAETESLGPLIRRIRHETGCSILIIEHDIPLITAVADELVALERGSVVVRGSADTVLNDERVITAFLGGTDAAIRRSGALG